jgi:23S rRNA (guanine2445-N2)-methyltransferase
MKFIAKTFHGLEDVLEEELKSLGAKKIRKSKRACLYEGDKELLYKSNLYLRTAIRILVPFEEFVAFDENRLYKKIRHIDWSEYFSLDQTFAIDTTVSSSRFRHSKYLALKIKDAIVDQFRDEFGSRPSVDTENPDFRLNVHCNETNFTLSVDSSGNSLHKRGYRESGHQAPLNEVLAAGMILSSGWDGESMLIDPMCGSGTILLEAAMIAKNIPPNFERNDFAFMKLKDFDENLWNKVYSDAEENIKKSEKIIFGYDKDDRALHFAKNSIAKFGLSNVITLSNKSFEENVPKNNSGLLIMNPPYDERMKEENIIAFYQMIGDQLKTHYQGFSAWILSGNKNAIKRVGLKASRRLTLFNGPIECKFHRFDMYSGSKKGKYLNDNPQTQ